MIWANLNCPYTHNLNNPRIFDLEERLVDFASEVIKVITKMPYDRVTKHLGDQLLRAGTSAALNYGEALAAESRRDFVHKLKIVLKELKESMVAIKVLTRTSYLGQDEVINKECDELIAIFTKSIVTAKRNLQNKESDNESK